MKTSSVTLSLLTATLFAIPALAQDAPAGAPPPPPPGEMPPPDLPPPPFGHEREGHRDGPGRFDEAPPHRPGGPGQRPDFKRMMYQHEEMVHRFDKDGDGHLNEAERAEARKAAEAMRERAKVAREETLSRFDKNGDGRLDENERADLRQAWQDFIKSRPVVAPAATTK